MKGRGRHGIFSKYGISDGACRMASLYHTCPIGILKQVIDHLHRVGCRVFYSHVDGRLERLSMQNALFPAVKSSEGYWWIRARKGGFLVVCSNNSRIQTGKRRNKDQCPLYVFNFFFFLSLDLDFCALVAPFAFFAHILPG